MNHKQNSYIEYEYREITAFFLIGIFMAIVLPLALGFVFRSFQESFVVGKPLEFGTFLTSFMIYYIWILAGLIGLPVLKIREMLSNKRGQPVEKQKALFNISILHDPFQDGLLWNLFRKVFKVSDEKNPMRFSKSMLRMFVISLLFFGLICLFKTFTSIPTINMQVTNTMRVLFSAEPASFAETTLMIFILSSMLGLVAYLVDKFKLPNAVYWVGSLVVSLINGIFWMLIHSLVYSNSEVDLLSTFIFGWIGSTLTVLFGTFIIFYCWHLVNNAFAEIRNLGIANTDLMFLFWLVYGIIFISYIAIEIFLYTRRKKKRLS
jgi:hypothetical protein